MNLADAVNNGELSKIPLDVNGTEVTLGVSSVGLCTDYFCNSSNVTTIAHDQSNGAVFVMHMHYMAIVTGSLLLMFAWL